MGYCCCCCRGFVPTFTAAAATICLLFRVSDRVFLDHNENNAVVLCFSPLSRGAGKYDGTKLSGRALRQVTWCSVCGVACCRSVCLVTYRFRVIRYALEIQVRSSVSVVSQSVEASSAEILREDKPPYGRTLS